MVNWFGVADVNDVIDDGPHKANAAARWFGSLPNRSEVAHRVSPLTYIRAGAYSDHDHPRQRRHHGSL